MAEKKFINISEAELRAKGVSALSDKPNLSASYGVAGLTPTQLKAWFDQLAALLAGKINAIHDFLNGSGIPQYIAVTLTGLYAGSGSDTYSLQELCNSFTDGNFAKYMKAQASAAAEALSPLQTIINNLAAKISAMEEAISSGEIEVSVDTVFLLNYVGYSGTMGEGNAITLNVSKAYVQPTGVTVGDLVYGIVTVDEVKYLCFFSVLSEDLAAGTLSLSATATNYMAVTDSNIPKPATSDSGKVLKVNAKGEWELAELESGVDIPTPTTSANGKILGVINGAYALVDGASIDTAANSAGGTTYTISTGGA